MATRMLIDARHLEETRVAVVKGNRIEEFDFESAEHKQIKGNIYLAKVTRVEPSLQAAFVDFGGNRHGFLAFNEIHPDYYQIPQEDRERLLAEEAEAAEEEARLRAEEEEEHLKKTKLPLSKKAISKTMILLMMKMILTRMITIATTKMTRAQKRRMATKTVMAPNLAVVGAVAAAKNADVAVRVVKTAKAGEAAQRR